jgi:hypothetical protein
MVLVADASYQGQPPWKATAEPSGTLSPPQVLSRGQLALRPRSRNADQPEA